MEAGRLWKVRSYQSLGVLLLQRIAREEVAELPGFGEMLLPGRVGFAHSPVWTVNPSYLPPQLMARMAGFHGPWAALHKIISVCCWRVHRRICARLDRLAQRQRLGTHAG